MIRLFWFISSLGLLAFVLAYQPTVVAAQQQSAWDTSGPSDQGVRNCESEEFGYRFSYPSYWEQLPVLPDLAESNVRAVVGVSRYAEPDSQFSVIYGISGSARLHGVSMQVSSLDEPATNFEAVLLEYDGSDGRIAGFRGRVLESALTSVDGLRALIWTPTVVDDPSATDWVVTTIRGDRLYAISCENADVQFSIPAAFGTGRIADGCAQVLDTLALVEPTFNTAEAGLQGWEVVALALGAIGAALLLFGLARVVRLIVGRMNWVAFTIAIVGYTVIIFVLMAAAGAVGGSVLVFFAFYGSIAAGLTLLIKGETVRFSSDVAVDDAEARLPKKFADLPSLVGDDEQLEEVSWVAIFDAAMLTDKRIVMSHGTSIEIDKIVSIEKTLAGPWQLIGSLTLAFGFGLLFAPWGLLTRRLRVIYEPRYEEEFIYVERPSRWLARIEELRSRVGEGDR